MMIKNDNRKKIIAGIGEKLGSNSPLSAHDSYSRWKCKAILP